MVVCVFVMYDGCVPPTSHLQPCYICSSLAETQQVAATELLCGPAKDEENKQRCKVATARRHEQAHHITTTTTNI